REEQVSVGTFSYVFLNCNELYPEVSGLGQVAHLTRNATDAPTGRYACSRPPLAPVAPAAAASLSRYPRLNVALKVCCMSREVAERPQGDRLLTASHGHSRVEFAWLNGSRASRRAFGRFRWNSRTRSLGRSGRTKFRSLLAARLQCPRHGIPSRACRC